MQDPSHLGIFHNALRQFSLLCVQRCESFLVFILEFVFVHLLHSFVFPTVLDLSQLFSDMLDLFIAEFGVVSIHLAILANGNFAYLFAVYVFEFVKFRYFHHFVEVHFH